jgi:molybdopterin-guanine dinucleotide biosynthesis protein
MDMVSAPIVAVFGGPSSGKTTLLCDLCIEQHKNGIEIDEFMDSALLDVHVKNLRERLSGKKQSCVVIDGCNDSWVRSGGFKNIVANGRCIHTGLMASFDDTTRIELDASLCTNIDYVFVFGSIDREHASTLYQLFMKDHSRWIDLNGFCKMLSQLGEDPFACLVMVPQPREVKGVEDLLWWYKAVDHRDRFFEIS